MAWVTGIKQVTTYQPEPERDGDGRQSMGRQAIPKPARVVSSLLPRAIERTLQPQTALPESTGAGPCGAYARRESALGVIAWSLLQLAQPLQAWYAEQNRPRDPLSRAGLPHGARSGGGNGRTILW